tara:strand:- start:1919 stop:2086 length:168 start_codon:yes stop_codon:yes gene_type:complete
MDNYEKNYSAPFNEFDEDNNDEIIERLTNTEKILYRVEKKIEELKKEIIELKKEI